MDDELKAPPADLLDGAALFLDFDGTLVELAETPDSVRVASHLPGLLRRLSARLDGRIAIISGRAIDDLEQHLDCTGVAVSGSHGLELRLADGTRLPLAATADLGAIRAEALAFADGEAGLLIEEKPAGIAIHYRQAAEAAERVERFMSALAEKAGLAVQHGKMVVELRPHGADKGDALRALMREPGFMAARPVFVGDDLTDEHAFGAASELGGGGVLVGPARATVATWRLDDVDAVAAWLEAAT